MKYLDQLTRIGALSLALAACTTTGPKSQTSQLPAAASQPQPVAVAAAVMPEKAPEENRFSKVVLAEKLDEPMQLSVLDDGRILFSERKGKLKLYDPAAKTTRVVGAINVYTENEDGLLGFATDPDFSANHFLYLYYSPAGSEEINRLSRFVFREGQLDLASEKIMLTVPTKRACCHSGGSLAFGPGGNLFLSLGDDTNPFESASYNPIDERPGRAEPWDAQRSSGNSNDLRGKILRIHPEPDGSYTIPEGNLFPKGMALTRPEVYTMGHRNPFRIAVDPKTNFLYWGEVGPDAGQDSIGRGPMGYDEVNQARQAGNFGWPYFIADNKAYWDYDFEKQKSGKQFDPQAPVNDSPNNTGIKNLPAAQKAFIWYPYQESTTFPLVGKGGRNAMAGPVFYQDLYEPSEVRFPPYYHGKLFIFDWMRDWIMAVTMDQNGNYAGMERFMEHTVFNKPVHMQFGKDGALYVLEYGTFWSSQNDDSRLSRIEFSEANRKPVVKASLDKKAAAAPATIAFSSQGSFDYDQGDKLSYAWSFDAPGVVQSREANPTFTFTRPGLYRPLLKVKDSAGKEAEVELEVQIGNAPPEIAVELQGNRSFYWDNTVLPYRIRVKDKEDGSLEKGSIAARQVKATFSYLQQGHDKIQAAQGHQVAAGSHELPGKALMEGSDCKACHATDKASVGPSLKQVAARYKGQADAVDLLARKIIAGGGGAWGERQMSAHPQLSKAEAAEMVRYILSLTETVAASPVKAIPLKGRLSLHQHTGKGREGTYLLSVSYQDKGAAGIPAITAREEITLRHPVVLPATCDFSKGVMKRDKGLVRITEDQAYFGFANIDLAGVEELIFRASAANQLEGEVEVRQGSPEGKLLASQLMKPDSKGKLFRLSLPATSGSHDLYFVFRTKRKEISIWNTFDIASIEFRQGALARKP